MTSMCRLTPSARQVSARRLSDTAVTPSDRSIEKATVSAYEWSLPTRVMSVPWSVVTTFGTRASFAVVSRICRAR